MRYVAGNFIPKAVMVQEVFPTNSICSYSPPLSLTYVPDTLLQDANNTMAKRITSILFMVGRLMLIITLDKTPGPLVGFALSIVKIDAFVLLPGRNNTFRLIDPPHGKPIPCDAVVSEKVFP